MLAAQQNTDIAVRAILATSSGDRAEIDATTHLEWTNRESGAEPVACRGSGPDAQWATSLWLHSAFPDVRHEIRQVVADGDLVVAHTVMSGTQLGPFIVHDQHARVKRVFTPTGKQSTVTQTHWIRIREGLCIEHWANRDDQGMAEQLGWIPPSPLFLLRCARATRRARRAQQKSS